MPGLPGRFSKPLAEIKQHSFENILPRGLEIIPGSAGLPGSINSVEIDSRKCSPGSLFVALPGENTHGHNFLADAAEAGAVAAIVERKQSVDIPQLIAEDSLAALQALAANFRDEFGSRVVGITGSCGKTTVKEMVAGLLSAEYTVGKTPGNYNNQIGLPLTVLNKGGRDILVAEVATNSRGEIEKLTEILRPEVGVITHIGPAHLEGLGTLENVAAEKSDLLAGLPADGLAVIPEDLDFISRVEAASAVSPVKVGGSERADFRVSWKKHNSGSKMIVEGHQISVSLEREEFLKDAALALCVAERMGLPPARLNNGAIGSLQAVSGRGRLEEISGCLVIDGSYNANPDSVISALDHLAQLPAPRLAVLGDMLELGDSAAEFHRRVGKKLSELERTEIHYVGRHGAEVKEGLSDEESIHLHDDVEEIMGLSPAGYKSALVKSSNAVGLYRLVDRWRDQA